ncbi:MAG: FAD-binding protein [Gammaproteobacteria bacterium]|nr:FAD-binding protein [Gammaproteobacteria bacterium]
MKILMIAEPDVSHFRSVNQHTLTAAMQLNGEIDLLFPIKVDEGVLETARCFSSIKKVLYTTSDSYTHALPENTSALIASLAKNYDYVLMAATTSGKNILPRVAALLDVSMISDVVEIISADTFVRPIYAGNALATVQTQEKCKLLTIRGTGFSAAIQDKMPTAALEKVNEDIQNTLSTFVSEQRNVSTRPELSDARIIISGGRGLKNAENFHMIESLADCLGAAVGASRAAVDAGFAPNDWQVGQTGKIVAPDLYIAVGISGAIQHLAGMKDSKVIVAINSDPDAPIFEVADYCFIGDLFTILPALQNALTQHIH